MAFRVKAIYYSGKDNMGQTIVIESDNRHSPLKLEHGEIVYILPELDSVVKQISESVQKDRTVSTLAPAIKDDVVEDAYR